MADLEFDTICDRLEIPEALRKHVAPSSAARGKLAVARGILPAPPRTLLAMQYLLLGDPDAQVRGEAEKSLIGMPAERLEALLGPTTHPKLLEFLVYRRVSDVVLMERVVLLRQINDKSLCYLAENATVERIAEMIGQNQERLITTPQVVRFLKRNPRAGAALIDRCVSFLRLYGIDVDQVTEAERARSEAAHRAAEDAEVRAIEEAARAEQARKAPAPSQELPSEPLAVRGPAPAFDELVRGPLPSDFVPGEVYLGVAPAEAYTPPPGLLNPLAELLADWGIPLAAEFVGAPYPVAYSAGASDVAGPPIFLVEPADLSGSSELGTGATKRVAPVDLTGLSSLAESDFAFGFDEDQDSFDGFLTNEAEVESEALIGSIGMAVSTMSVGDKIKLAYKGNKVVRELLIRDTNKIVACAVVKSGRITENEVMTIATNRAIHEDVIRELARVKEYLRKYPVKVALAGNPKTPIPVTMRLLTSLHVKDLKNLSKNRNVSSAIFTQAGKLYEAKKSQRGG